MATQELTEGEDGRKEGSNASVSELINRLLQADLEKESAVQHGGGMLAAVREQAGAVRRQRAAGRKSAQAEATSAEERRAAEERARLAEVQLLELVQRERQEAALRRSRRKKKRKTTTKKKPQQLQRPKRSADGDDNEESSSAGGEEEDEGGAGASVDARNDAHDRADSSSSPWERVISRAARRREGRASSERRHVHGGDDEDDADDQQDRYEERGRARQDRTNRSTRARPAKESGNAPPLPSPSSSGTQSLDQARLTRGPQSNEHQPAPSRSTASQAAPFQSSLHFPPLPSRTTATQPSSSSPSPLAPQPSAPAQMQEVPPPPPAPQAGSCLGDEKSTKPSGIERPMIAKTKDEDSITTNREQQSDPSIFDALYTNLQKLKSQVEEDEQRTTSTEKSEESDDNEDSAWSDKGQVGWSEDEGPYRGRGEYISEHSRRSSRRKESVWGSRMTGSLWSETNEWDRSDLTIEQVLKQQARMEGMGEMTITQQLVVALNNQMNEHMNDISRQMESIITVLVALDTKVRHLEDKQTQFHSWLLHRERQREEADHQHQPKKRD